MTDRLGEAFSRYRARVYGSGFSGKATLPMAAVLELCETGLAHLDDTIRRSRRSDGLFHSYNLLRPEQAAIGVDHLYEMLEGQVAAISSGLLTATEIADVVEALFDSALWRSDQQSFMLYPKRRLPSFLHKNIVPAPDVQANPLLAALAESGEESVIVTDVDGNHRFSSDFANRRDLEEALAALGPAWRPLVDRHREEALTVYEDVFRHRRFTGRSGSMYAYEGIGSIYWHMVAKLLVAIQEAFVDAATEGTSQEAERLAGCYRRVRAGLGFNKTAAEYGAFPADPYSHTPAHAGAQQPGMTGQVKEEIITRFGELGVRVAGGTVRFDPGLLDREEFLSEPAWWEVVAANGETGRIELLPGSLGFTVCGVPVVYRLAGEESELAASVVSHAGDSDTFPGAQLDSNTSRRLFARDGSIQRIDVAIPVSALTAAGG